MIVGIRFFEIKVQNGIICDWHHRYLASLLAKYEIERIPSVATAEVVDWNVVVFVEDDWDTIAKIQMLNEKDAEFNNIPIGDLNKLLQ